MQLHRFARRGCGVVASAIAVSPLVTHAAILPGLNTETEALEWLIPGPQFADADSNSGVPGPRLASAMASLSGGESVTSAVATTDFGFVDVFAESVGTYSSGPGQFLNLSATSHASFSDEGVVVNAPGFGPGQFGSFTAQFELNHHVEFLVDVLSNNGGRIDISGGFQLEIVIGDASAGPYGGVPWTFSTVNPPTSPTIPSGPIDVLVNFEYGVPFTIAADIEIGLFTAFQGDISAEIDASMDLESVFFWQGIDTSTLPEGAAVSSNAVPDWTAAYPNNIPAAPTATALLTVVMASGRRRRRH